MRARRSRRSTVVLALLCLGLGYAVYTELRSGRAGPDAVTVPAVPPQPEVAPPAEAPFSPPPLEGFAETLERPLFLPSRRPLAAEEEAPKEAVAGPGRDLFTLMGVIISPDERMAVIKRRRSGEVLRVVEGQPVDGWLVEAILPDRVTLRHGDETEEIEIKDVPGAAPARGQPPGRRPERPSQPPTDRHSPAEQPGTGLDSGP